ncbi:MAG: helix-turn-helix domain-containing protein [Acidobacteriia bacterium]|nr:helix-turn-helix domain-containing protein [Terriglobia bacterium]
MKNETQGSDAADAKLITTGAAAKVLGCCGQTVRRYLESGLLRGCRPNPCGYFFVLKHSALELKAARDSQIS